MTFSASWIDEMIKCEKRITDPPAREYQEEYRHRRKDCDLDASVVANGRFRVFMRQSLEFAEDFSIGLVYLAPDGKRMTLIRFNGQHDQSNDPFDLAKPHFQYHIHKATPENLARGRLDKHPGEVTGRYASFDQAIHLFLSEVGVRAEDVQKHFGQPSLEFKDMGGT